MVDITIFHEYITTYLFGREVSLVKIVDTTQMFIFITLRPKKKPKLLMGYLLMYFISATCILGNRLFPVTISFIVV